MTGIINKTKDFVKEEMYGESTGHDWWHVRRVWKNAKQLLQEEDADREVVELAALLHDLDDYKKTGDREPRQAREFLKENNVEEEKINKVCNIIENISFKGKGTDDSMDTREGEIVQDADRLDAMGAIGIARAFAYGGSKDRELYNPEEKPEFHESFEEYKDNESTTINHFYEKLLHLKERMNTEKGREVAEKRHRYMEGFLERFYKEWKGEA